MFDFPDLVPHSPPFQPTLTTPIQHYPTPFFIISNYFNYYDAILPHPPSSHNYGLVNAATERVLEGLHIISTYPSYSDITPIMLYFCMYKHTCERAHTYTHTRTHTYIVIISLQCGLKITTNILCYLHWDSNPCRPAKYIPKCLQLYPLRHSHISRF